MTERLTLKNLGPIKEFTVEPRPLTVLIGEQATGKSLVAQLLFFFRSLKPQLSGLYRPDLTENEDWCAEALKTLLDRLRGVPFGYFANGRASLQYEANGIDRKINIYKNKRKVAPAKALQNEMTKWVDSWRENFLSFGLPFNPEQVFIPTERSVFTRLWNQAQAVLFAEHQPWPLRIFANSLAKAYSLYQKAYHSDFPIEQAFGHFQEMEKNQDFILECQRRALAGEAYVPKHGPQLWKWKVSGEESKVIPIEAIASGQMEAWPFFVVAATFGIQHKAVDFYFEEPETHLHPRAQVEIMKAIVFLVNHGHRFVITTHSPFLLYVLNNMIQRFLTYGENSPEGTIALDPEKVVAYRMGAEPGTIMDREDTGLIDLNDLEKVADELGGEFDRLLEAAESGAESE